MSKLRTIIERDGHIFAVQRRDGLEVVFVNDVEIGVAFERTDWAHMVLARSGKLAWFTRKQVKPNGGYYGRVSNEIPAETLKGAVERFAVQYCNELKALRAKAEAEAEKPENLSFNTLGHLSVHKVESVPHLFAIRWDRQPTNIAFVHVGWERYVRANTPSGIMIGDGFNHPFFGIDNAIASLTEKDIDDGLADPWTWGGEEQRAAA